MQAVGVAEDVAYVVAAHVSALEQNGGGVFFEEPLRGVFDRPDFIDAQKHRALVEVRREQGGNRDKPAFEDFDGVVLQKFCAACCNRHWVYDKCDFGVRVEEVRRRRDALRVE